MNDKLKEALEGVDYKKPNTTGVAVTVLVILFIVFFLFIIPPFSDPEPVVKKVKVQSNSNVRQAQWDGVSAGDVPVGVWSKSFKINPGCRTRYNAGYGSLYKIRYRFYSNKWHDRVPGVSVDASEIQFMALKKGITEIPFTVTCK